MNTSPPGPTTEPPPPGQQQWPPPSRPPWRMARRAQGRMLGGVSTGLADAFGIDVLVVRVLWVVFALVSLGVGVAAYAVCWIAFPNEESPAPINRVLHEHRHHTENVGYIVAVVLLGIGLLIVFVQLLALHPLRRGGGLAFATLLIGGGIAVLLLRKPDHHSPNAPGPGPQGAGAPYPNAAPAASESAGADPARAGAIQSDDVDRDDTSSASIPFAVAPDPTATGPAPSLPSGVDPTVQLPTAEQTATAWTQHAPWPAPPRPPRPPRPRRPRSFLTPLTLSVLLIGAGVVTLLDDNGSTHLTAAEILAGALCVVGLALVLSTWLGRARLLIPLGILLLIATIPAATVDVPLTGGVGNHDYDPLTRSEIQSKYEMGIGRLHVDLTDAPLAGRISRVHAQLGIGEMAIDVPSTVRVVVHAHAGAGSVQLFGANQGGWPEQQTRTAPGTSGGELDLDLRVGAGDIVVRRFDATGAETIFPEKPIPPAAPFAPTAPIATTPPVPTTPVPTTPAPTTPETVR